MDPKYVPIHDDSAKYYPNTPTGHPHIPPGMIGAIVLFAFVVIIWWLASRSSSGEGEEHSGRKLSARRALKRAWLPIARLVRRQRPAGDDDQRPSTSSMS